jgi:anti-sigma-K factor RskA
MSPDHQKKPRLNIELYIQSGIVESYALGLATSREVAEFEQLLPHYPELKDSLSDFEYNLELFSIDQETPPPPDVRERIEARLRELPAIRRPGRSGGQYRRERSERSADYIRVESASSTHIWVHKNWRAWFIAFCIVSKIFLVLAVYYYVEYRYAQQHVQQLEQQLGKKEGVGPEAK